MKIRSCLLLSFTLLLIMAGCGQESASSERKVQTRKPQIATKQGVFGRFCERIICRKCGSVVSEKEVTLNWIYVNTLDKKVERLCHFF